VKSYQEGSFRVIVADVKNNADTGTTSTWGPYNSVGAVCRKLRAFGWKPLYIIRLKHWKV